MNQKNTRLVWIYLLYDVAIIIASFLGSIYLKYRSLDPGKYYIFLPLIIFIWIIIVLGFTSQNYRWRDGFYSHFRSQVIDFMIFTGIVCTLILVLDLKLYSRLILFGTILMFFFLRNLGLIVIYKYLVMMRSKGRHVKRLLIVGAGRIGGQLYHSLVKDATLGYKVVGFLDDNPDMVHVPHEMVLGRLADFEKIVLSKQAEEVILAIPLTATDEIKDAIEKAEFQGLRISIIPDYYQLIQRPFEARSLGTLPLINIREITLDNFLNKALKRVFDIMFSLIVIFLLFPLFVLIGIMIKLDSKGPIFYMPKRVGLGGEEFTCLKFRSMTVDLSPNHAAMSTVENDPRITKLGAFLRKYSLDELPQFYNVLIGEMSVVGPRPHRRHLNEHMQKKVEGYMLRHYIKPGITGWAQVNGWRGPTTTAEQKLERTRHDLWYIENWNMWLDLRIIWMTVFGNSNKNAF